MNYVCDTHSLVWYFTDDPRLGKKALEALKSATREGFIIVPVVVLAEIMYIAKKGKITLSFDETLEMVQNNHNFIIATLQIDILKIANKIERELEMHDKLILATALYFEASLITKDEIIKDANIVPVVW